MNSELLRARQELGENEFNSHFRTVFGIELLDFVRTIVINLPEPCFANCEYCIDKYLRKNSINSRKFLDICRKVLKEFPNVKSVSITGGTLNPRDFCELVDIIKESLPESRISWNTNGVGITEEYAEAIYRIDRINLHRNSIDDVENQRIFKATKSIITLEQAKKLFKEKLFIRVTIDSDFNLDDYAKKGIPLYLNRLLPGTEKSNEKYLETLRKLKISEEVDRRRRNVYLSAEYKEIPVRICVGDKLATRVPGRNPTYLNVAIVHRSGIVCGSWFEDDKVIFKP